MLINYKNIKKHQYKKVHFNINMNNRKNGMNLLWIFKIADFINLIN